MGKYRAITILGTVSSVAGAIVSIASYAKYHEAKGMVDALEDGAALFGYDSISEKSISIWESHASNHRLVLIIGLIALFVGVILMFTGILLGMQESKHDEENRKANTDTNRPGDNIQERMEKLNSLKDNALISDDEYEEKRKEIISSL